MSTLAASGSHATLDDLDNGDEGSETHHGDNDGQQPTEGGFALRAGSRRENLGAESIDVGVHDRLVRGVSSALGCEVVILEHRRNLLALLGCERAPAVGQGKPITLAAHARQVVRQPVRDIRVIGRFTGGVDMLVPWLSARHGRPECERQDDGGPDAAREPRAIAMRAANHSEASAG